MDHPVNPCSSPACTFNDLFINCKGNCRQRFHAVCVGLSAEDVPAIISSPNLFWFCDGCRDDILTFRAAVRPPEHPVLGGEMSCGTKKCIFTDQLIRCDGPCGKDFHGMCVRLDRTDLAVIESSGNILWVCDGCKCDVRGESDEDLAEEPAELEPEHQDVDDSMVVRMDTKFKSIIEKLTRLSNSLEKGVYTPPDSVSNSEGSSGDEDSHEMNDTVVESGTTSGVTDNEAASKVMEAEVEEIVDNLNADLIKNNSESPVKNTDQCPKTPDSSTKEDQAEPKTEQSPGKDFPKLQIFTFGGSKQVESSVKNINFSFSKPIDCVEKFKNILEEQKNKLSKPKPVNPVEPQKDENNNSSKTEHPPVETAPIQLAKKDDSKFALWIKFNDPDISSSDACSVIRQALGMFSHEPISARNVVPGHIRFSGQACYASFKVDLDAFWRKKALDGATWKLVQDYMEHAEWINRW